MSESESSDVREEIPTENPERSADSSLKNPENTVSRESLQQPESPQAGIQDVQTSSTSELQDSNDVPDVSREAMIEKARVLQASLLEIAESIELVKVDHDKLEKQNLALQDYIGGLTRAMSKGQAPKKAKGSGK